MEGVPAPYLRALRGAGLQPVVLPTGLAAESVGRLLQRVDGVLLIGGPDVEPRFYGEETRPQCGPTHPERDQSELLLVGEALDRGLPLLAICRGIQLLNVALGGTLHQDIATDRPDSGIGHRSQERQALAHTVRLEPDSLVARAVCMDHVAVNTLHHQAVKSPATSLRPVGWAPDGLVEAVEMPGADFVVGVQWHPEELVSLEEHARRLFAAFAVAAARHQSAASRSGS